MEENNNTEKRQETEEQRYLLDQQQINEIILTSKKKGQKKGALITILIVFVIAICVLTFNLAIKIANGTIISDAISTFYSVGGKAIVDKGVVNKLNTLSSIIDKYYLNDIEETALQDGLYKGLLSSLGDPYSVYYTKQEYSDLMESSVGIYYGIGAYLQQNPDTMEIKVVRPIPGTPAEEVGLLADDIIKEVNGEDVTDQDINLVVAQIRGEEGSQVNIGVAREGEPELLYFDITRRKVESVTVESEMLEDNIGYIQISEFDDVTKGQFTKAYEDLNDAGMESLILDLRDNPGGNLDVAVDIADLLLPEGLVVYTQDKYGNKDEYKTDAEHVFGKPMIVLVNGNSASASEILSGAIKDYGAGKLLGTTTYGKGIVQQILPLGDGSGVKVTVSKYYTPNGNNIHEIGIEPDIELELDVDAFLEDRTDNQKLEAIRLLKEEMKK